MSKKHPIGIFDSGIGGTSIWKEITDRLPQENTVYLADSLHAPYGEKSREEVIQLSFKNIDFLLKYHTCKIIVVACNTATTNAIVEMRQKYHIPIIGIEPAIKPAALSTKTSKIGILATKGTITSEFFSSKVKLYPTIEIYEQIGYDLVRLIEVGQIESQKVKQLLETYLNPMVDKGIDSLVLGCTHYPYLKPLISQIIPPHIKIIDSGMAVAKQTEKVLVQNNLLNNSLNKGTHTFYTNTNSDILKSFIPKDAVVIETAF